MVTDVFLSRPSKLPPEFEAAYKAFHKAMETEHNIRLRRLGDTDYFPDAPLRAIIEIMSECRGAIVLGYPQIEIFHHVRKSVDVTQLPSLLFPTPWNQIEGSLAYGADLPVLVVAHPGVGGGVFDHGVTGQFVLTEDLSTRGWHTKRPFQQLLEKWLIRVTPTKRKAKAAR